MTIPTKSESTADISLIRVKTDNCRVGLNIIGSIPERHDAVGLDVALGSVVRFATAWFWTTESSLSLSFAVDTARKDVNSVVTTSMMKLKIESLLELETD